jgi:carboxypeptidase C (cathepsin A)
MFEKSSRNEEVTSLPYATSAMLSKHYSGYLEIDNFKRLHYFYIESENDPETDSVIFWTNGGPG